MWLPLPSIIARPGSLTISPVVLLRSV